MPGRGTPWRVGGHRDETIALEDLTQALQAQITGGGGAGKYELLGETTLGSNNQIVTVSITPENLSDFCFFEAVFIGVLNNNTNVGWRINGITTGYVGHFLEFDKDSVQVGGLSSNNAFTINGGTNGDAVFSKITIQGLINPTGKLMVQVQATSEQAGTSGFNNSLNHGFVTTTDTAISSVTMDGLSEDWQTGARLCLYGIRRP